MKKLFLLVLFSALALRGLTAQDTIRTVFQHAKLHSIGLYVAPEVQYGQSNGAFTTYTGASLMMLFNNKFAAGVSMERSIPDHFSPKGVAPLVLRSSFAGAKLEYNIHPSSAIHIGFPLVIGRGFASADSASVFRGGSNNMHEFPGGGRRDSTGLRGSYFVIQPGIQIEANLFKWARLFAGVSYRIAGPVGDRKATLPNDALSGVSFNVGLKVGCFAMKARRS